MGVIVNSEITTENGIAVSGAYVCVDTDSIIIYCPKMGAPFGNRFLVEAKIKFYKDFTYRESMKPFDTKQVMIEVDKDNLCNPYELVYRHIKGMYPNVQDHDQSTPSPLQS